MASKKSATKRMHSNAFKMELVDKVLSKQGTATAIAEAAGVNKQLLGKWVQQYRDGSLIDGRPIPIDHDIKPTPAPTNGHAPIVGGDAEAPQRNWMAMGKDLARVRAELKMVTLERDALREGLVQLFEERGT
jgi:transposase-like protein